MIEKTKGVCGGSACIKGTRIPAWAIVRYQQLGATNISILSNFPTLTSENLSDAWKYFVDHSNEITKEIIANEE